MPTDVKYAETKDYYYPIEYDGVVFDTFNLKVPKR